MYGRYGGDNLCTLLLVIGLILGVVGAFTFYPIVIISYGFYIYALFRIFSKNIPARQREYYSFLSIISKIKCFFRNIKLRIKDRKVLKYFKCPKCKQRLRAPRGRGEILVTCQRCKNQFKTKT